MQFTFTNFPFTIHEPCWDRIVFVLTLDREKMQERILIGEEQEIRFHLDGDKKSSVYDITRPLGSLLFAYEYAPDGEWNSHAIMNIQDALTIPYEKYSGLTKNSKVLKRFRLRKLMENAFIANTEDDIFYSHPYEEWNNEYEALIAPPNALRKKENEIAEFLHNKFESENPVAMYAAFRLWNGYLLGKEADWDKRGEYCNRFLKEMELFATSFAMAPLVQQNPKSKRFEINNPVNRFRFPDVPKEENTLNLWYPSKRISLECVCVYESFTPLITYYSNRLAAWGLKIQKCKICEKIFLVNNLRTELCSKACRSEQGTQNKREFDKRAKDNEYDKLYANACQYWRNQIKKAENKGFSNDELLKMKSEFKNFKEEALVQKNDLKEKLPASYNAQLKNNLDIAQETQEKIQKFRNWLYDKEKLINKYFAKS